MTDVLTEPRADRISRWLHEAEQHAATVARQFAELAARTDDDGIAELNPGDIWDAFTLPPATATMISRRLVRAFCVPFVVGHTGPLVICSAAKPFTPGCEHRAALAVVNIKGELPFNHAYLPALGMSTYDARLRRQRVIFFDDVRPIVPFGVTGQIGVYRIAVPRPR